MTKTERILAVIDPAAATQPAVARAAQLAKAMGWGLELLACLHERLPVRIPKSVDGKTVRRQLLAHQLGYLKDLAGRHPGVQIATKAVWDWPLHEAIIRETLRIEPRLVVKDSHFHSAISRALVTNTDWQLARDCPAPLWLVRRGDWPAHPSVLAMVDPTHEHDKPAELDHRIVAEAGRLAAGLGGELHLVHCFHAAPLAATAGPLGIAATGGADMRSAVADLFTEHRTRLDELATHHGIPPERVHLRHGPPANAIPEAVSDLGGDLAVMGVLSRSGLQKVFLGNTAETVLDRLACDVLMVKPARFESPVTYRPQAADFMELS
jgi:universal stress protein E